MGKEKLAKLKVITPEGCNAVGPVKELEEVEVSVDSGASETVAGSDMLEHVPTQPSSQHHSCDLHAPTHKLPTAQKAQIVIFISMNGISNNAMLTACPGFRYDSF